MLTDKQKINQLQIIIDEIFEALEHGEDIYYFMIERDKYLHLIRDYEHYQKESEEE
tara:strand:- start:317 stop:484 length:168 start_codon:yes stop_codon:yes gene_type:complete